MNCFETTGSWLSSNRIIMPMSSRTDGLDPKNQTGGERGIRTLDTLLEYARFPGVCLQPLGHLSAGNGIVPSPPLFSIQIAVPCAAISSPVEIITEESGTIVRVAGGTWFFLC